MQSGVGETRNRLEAARWLGMAQRNQPDLRQLRDTQTSSRPALVAKTQAIPRPLHADVGFRAQL